MKIIKVRINFHRRNIKTDILTYVSSFTLENQIINPVLNLKKSCGSISVKIVEVLLFNNVSSHSKSIKYLRVCGVRSVQPLN